MGVLITLLRNIAGQMNFGFGDLWRVMRKALGAKWAVMILMIGALFMIINYGVELGVELGTMIAAFIFPDLDTLIPLGAMQAISFANSIVPLTETLILTAVYGLELGVITLYRHIKTMIPSFLPGGGGS